MSDRNAARRRRSAQNKRERDARATRVAKARAGGSVPASTAKSTGGKTGSRGRASTPGPSGLGQRWTDAGSPNPGARMVLLSVFLAVVAGVMLYAFDIVPVRDEIGDQTIERTTSLGDEYGPKVLPYLAIPVLITAAAWFASRWSGRRRRRVYVVAAAMLWIWIMLNFTLGLLYIVSAISLSVGAWQYVNALRGEPPEPVVEVDEDDEVDEFEDDELDDDEVEHQGPLVDRPTVWSRLKGPFGR